MKLTNIRRIAREDLQSAPAWIDDLLTPLNSAIEQITQALLGQLDIANNDLSRILTQKFTHGVELIIKNPFKTGLKPIGMTCITSDSAACIDGFRYTYKTNGDIGVTVTFALPRSDVFLTLSGNQMIANTNDTAIIWTTQQRLSGGLSWSATTNPTRITATIAGKYLFTYSGAFVANAVGNRSFWISKNGVKGVTASRFGQTDIINNGAGGTWESAGSGIVDMAVNDFVELWCWQNSTGNLNIQGNASQETQLMGHSLDNSGHSANVTFVVYGG